MLLLDNKGNSVRSTVAQQVSPSYRGHLYESSKQIFRERLHFFKYLRCVLLVNLTVCKCAADFSLLNLPKGKSLGRSKPATNS
jgi:hypothetical protein